MRIDLTLACCASNAVAFTVVTAAPQITSANSTAFTIGTTGSFTVTATGSPSPAITEAGALPDGVTFNASTGVLSGNPVAGTAEIYPITFTAHNGVGSDAVQNFTLTVSNLATATVYYYFADELGTSRAITNSSGVVCYDADFYPFGGERVYTNNCDPDYKFTGKERDEESNLDYFSARYYSWQFGRFLTPDPAGTSATCPLNPQTQNRYVYVTDNPVNKTDPTGLCGDGDNSDCGGIGITLPILPGGGGSEQPAPPTPHPVFLSFFQNNRRPPLACVDGMNACLKNVEKKYKTIKAEQFGEYEDCLLDCINDDGPFGLPDLVEMAKCDAKCLAKYAAERTADVIGEAAEGVICSIQVGVPCFGPHGGPQ